MERLPLDCEVTYWPEFLAAEERRALFDEIVGGYAVADREVGLPDGTTCTMETGVYLFADAELTSYEAFPEAWGGRSPWPERLGEVRGRIEDAVGHRFQVARCVHYRDGGDGMAFHSDPPAYGPTDAIASLSLGAERRFVFRNIARPEKMYELGLADGSLLFMGEVCQERYQHAVPRCDTSTGPRINLTFRKYG